MRVLVVEDELGLRDAIVSSLREEHYAVDEAEDGQVGLLKAQQWSYDAIILDLMLPKIDGWQLLNELRETHDTPVLILTARDEVDDRVRGLDGGADDYMCKPFSLMELSARLRALIRRSNGQSTTQLIVKSPRYWHADHRKALPDYRAPILATNILEWSQWTLKPKN